MHGTSFVMDGYACFYYCYKIILHKEEILCMHGYIYALYICLASMKLPRIHILHIRMLVLCIGWNRDA